MSSVRGEFCDVCFAELDEPGWPPVDHDLDEVALPFRDA
jgi:hypothetical protein